MIQLPDLSPFQAAERYAIELLVDLSRLVPVRASDVPVLTLEVAGEGVGATSRPAREWVACGWGIEAGEGTVRIPRAALTALTAIAGVVAEQETEAADRHGRVPPECNALVGAGLERTPVVSAAGQALGRAARRAAGNRPVRFLAPWPEGRRWAVALTHDLDVVRWWPVFTALRLSELVGRGEWAQVGRVLGAIPRGLVGHPVAEALADVIAAERTRRVHSSWFVLCGTPTVGTMAAGDLTYHPESPLARALLEGMGNAGDEIGLHGSFETYLSPEALAGQRRRLGALIGRDVTGVRQHFLRLRPGATQRAMAESGFTYDASIGFPDRNGFRQGLADIVPLWDQGTGRALPIDEVPVVWMDRALSKYRGNESPDAWVADGLELAQASQDVEGLWTGVWHPNLAPALGFPGAPEAYLRLLNALLAREPYVATVGELVAWRRARRRACVERMGADGVVRATTESGPAVLEPA